MTWMRIRLELGRSNEFPEGSNRHGYEFILPVARGGKIDRDAYRKTPELCTVHRFWEGEDDRTGTIRHASHDRWLFTFYDGNLEEEVIPHLATHVFREGEYVTVRDLEGAEHAFRIVLAEPAPGLTTQRS